MENNKQRAEDIGELFMDRITTVVVPAITDVESSLAKINETQGKLAGQINEIKQDIAAIKSTLQKVDIRAATPDTRTFEALANGWFQKMMKTLEAYPKKHSFSILLFPENNALEYLKKLWRAVFLWLFLMVLGGCFYKLTNKWMDNQAEKKYKHAWETLYNSQNKKNQKIMDDYLNWQ
jgi:hypothetical protein